MLEITILNEKFERISIIDAYESVIWTDRCGTAGDFEIYTYASSSIFAIAKPGYFRTIPESDYVMMIETIKLTTDLEDGDRVIIQGRSLEAILDRRVVWEKTHINGDLQYELKRMINDAFINPTDENRKIDNFVIEDSTDEAVTKLKHRAEYHGETLYEVLTDVCKVYNLYYRIRLNSENQFVFKLHAGVDRSYSQETLPWVVYSTKHDNLLSSEFTESTSNVKNTALILGATKQQKDKDGNYYGIPKQLWTTLGETKGIERKELYVDASDINADDVSEEIYKQYMETRGYSELFNYTSENAFSRQVDTKRGYKYGVDYQIGDFVQFQNQYGMGVKVKVTEYTRSDGSSGLSEYPTFDQDFPKEQEIKVGVNLASANLNNWSFVTPSQKGTVIVDENLDLWHNNITFNTISGWEVIYKKIDNLDTTKNYVLSFEYKNVTGWEPSGGGLFGILISTSAPSAAATGNVISESIFQQDEMYGEQMTAVFKPTTSTVYLVINGGYLKDNQTYSFIIDHIKLEEGDTPTVWTRKPPVSS